MRYFSGFSLKGEEALFSKHLNHSNLCVSGFSYGAIQAFEYALNTSKRVDTLQLFSPAFFQTRNDRYKRLQLLSFKKDAQSYQAQFLKNIAFPKELSLDTYAHTGTDNELKALLNYQWSEEALEKLTLGGTNIEVYLGKEDKIIQSDLARVFFTPFATVYYIKEVGHIL